MAAVESEANPRRTWRGELTLKLAATRARHGRRRSAGTKARSASSGRSIPVTARATSTCCTRRAASWAATSSMLDVDVGRGAPRCSRRRRRRSSTAATARRACSARRCASPPAQRSNGCRRRRSCSAAPRGRSRPTCELEAGARFIGWEQLSLGRPLSGDRYATGTLEQHARDRAATASRCCCESLRFSAGDRLLAADCGLRSPGCAALFTRSRQTTLSWSASRTRLGAATPIRRASDVDAPALRRDAARRAARRPLPRRRSPRRCATSSKRCGASCDPTSLGAQPSAPAHLANLKRPNDGTDTAREGQAAAVHGGAASRARARRAA